MEQKDRLESGQISTQTSQETGRSFPDKVVSISLATTPLLSPILQLRDLIRTGTTPTSSPLQRSPIHQLWKNSVRIGTLEVVEAELANQQIFQSTAAKITLHQIAAYEASVYRWQAKRFSLSAEDFAFRVDVPRYVNYLAQELEKLQHEDGSASRSEIATRSLRWRAIFPHAESIRWAFQLVSAWAELLTQEHRATPTSGYNRAHRLLLGNFLHEKPENEDAITLPTTNRELLLKLRAKRK